MMHSFEFLLGIEDERNTVKIREFVRARGATVQLQAVFCSEDNSIYRVRHWVMT